MDTCDTGRNLGCKGRLKKSEGVRRVGQCISPCLSGIGTFIFLPPRVPFGSCHTVPSRQIRRNRDLFSEDSRVVPSMCVLLLGGVVSCEISGEIKESDLGTFQREGDIWWCVSVLSHSGASNHRMSVTHTQHSTSSRSAGCCSGDHEGSTRWDTSSRPPCTFAKLAVGRLLIQSC